MHLHRINIYYTARRIQLYKALHSACLWLIKEWDWRNEKTIHWTLHHVDVRKISLRHVICSECRNCNHLKFSIRIEMTFGFEKRRSNKNFIVIWIFLIKQTPEWKYAENGSEFERMYIWTVNNERKKRGGYESIILHGHRHLEPIRPFTVAK